MNRLKQKSTIVGVLSIAISAIGLYLGTISPEVAVACITNGLGLVATDA